MVTRWKSSINKIVSFIQSNKRLFLGICSVAIGAAIFYALFGMAYRYGGMSTKQTWFMGSVPNLFLGFGIWHIVRYIMLKVYADWIPKDEAFYEEWKDKWYKQQITIAIVSIGTLLFAYLMYSSSEYRYYAYNLAYMYLLLATVLIQSVIRNSLYRINR